MPSFELFIIRNFSLLHNISCNDSIINLVNSANNSMENWSFKVNDIKLPSFSFVDNFSTGLSEIFGEKTIETDKFMRRIGHNEFAIKQAKFVENNNEYYNIIKYILTIKNVFNKLREVINNREKELLLELAQIFNSLSITKDSSVKRKEFYNKIKKSIEFRKQIEKEWNSNKLNFFINETLIFEHMINEINNINNYLILNMNFLDSRTYFLF